ncbi:tRNA-specific 2-thiouridylase MnmA [Pseudobythopirellula maris]|uniref:tRNA-specific 2-thiouridylase MnmA n=1 Tax=Pseudobythopirellula maris TaxID=2527991 RepID=A0A5C5ZNJ5_9BACT|nr:tRNA 2-thiouridine(34) synthase MnmA [Pseudobythopirellula maris]TWT88487.1 tRNA-specific 2-thiouridylase MnmA [Pseudobythopirellula maris]
MLVVLAMSGGVDSSVAAHLLLEQGHDVVGVFMRHGEQSPAACGGETPDSALPIVQRLDHKQGCCTASDAEDARRVSDRLGIPFYAIDLNAEFGRIMDYFVEEYAHGRTPNPCVQCNNWIKFGKLFDYADSIGAECVATGHYARLEHREDGPAQKEYALLRGVDGGKDQSYVLAGISKELLPRMMLPVGGYEKPRIRELAAGVGLNVAEKKDSQEICFVTQGRYDAFVRRRLDSDEDRSGELVTTAGEVVGRHPGIEGFTIGQRKKLGVALGEPAYVVKIEPDTRRVVLGSREELGRSELTAEGANWLVDVAQGESRRCMAQIRYNSPATPAELTVLDGDRLRVVFNEPARGVTPGQAVVCYDHAEPDRVLGGGWIE